MPVSTRSRDKDDIGMIDKLDKILGLVETLGDRVKTLESSVNHHQSVITSFSRERRYSQSNHVDEACGVNPQQMKPNQLMGEVSEKRPDDLKSKTIRRAKQALGAKLYAAYIWVYVVLMALAYFGYVPSFGFEKFTHGDQVSETTYYMRSTLHVPIILSIAYVFTVFGIQHIMMDREAFDLRTPLAIWSFLLAIFSLVGSIKVVPALLKLLSKRSLGYAICGDTRNDWILNDPSGWWTYIFVLSKVPELIDTLFIVLRKRRLITLHWYHHITVMNFCWHAWATHCLYGIFFSAMNLTVHSFMYMFYCLAALGYRPSAFAQYITIIQILQMFAGTGITAYAAYHMTFIEPQDVLQNLFSLEWNLDANTTLDTSPKCKVNEGNVLAGLTMYSSYLWLFCVFFYHAYLAPRPKVTEEKKLN